jgi:hypothetical protein
MPILLAGLGLVVVVGVVVMMLPGGKKPTADTVGKTDPAATAPQPAAVADSPAGKPADAPAATEAAAPKATTPPPEPKLVEAPKPAEATPPPPPVDADPNRIKQPWELMKNPPTAMDQVTDPKSYGEVKWPDATDDGKKKEIRDLAADVRGGGKAGMGAKLKLKALGYEAMFGIVEQLQQLDYKSADDTMTGGEFHELLEDITAGFQANFSRAEATEVIVPAKAEWNSRRVKAWMDILAKYPTKAEFVEDKRKRAEKADDK